MHSPPTIIAAAILFSTGAFAQDAPLRFNDVVRAAVARNPLVEAARARVRAAEAGRVTARTIANPIATVQVENAPFPGQSSRTVATETSAFATLPLEFLYQRSPRVRRAGEDVRAAEADLASARWLIALDAARAFERMAVAQSSADAAADLRKGLEELRAYNERRVREGVAAEGELIRVRVEADRAAIEETLARAELARAGAELRQFVPDLAYSTGLNPPRVAVDTALRVSPIPQIAELMTQARARQPEILAARARVASARAESDYQRTLNVRQLGATFGSRRTAGEYTMIAGISIPLPFFDRNRGEIERATASHIAAEHELEWTERRIAAQVDAARSASTLLSTQLDSLSNDLLTRAEESREIAVAAYREGAGTLLQVIDASRALSEVRQAYYRALLARQASLLELQAAIGGDPLTEIKFDGDRQ